MARVLVPLAQGCEELEAITIIDLLRRAGIDVTVAGLEEGPVKASRGSVILPDCTLGSVKDQDFDMIVLPGGLPGADNLNDDPNVQQLLMDFSERKQWIGAICAAPKVLAKAGLLNGRKATSFPGTVNGIATVGMEYKELPVVVDGNIITSRGPGTAMDFALTLIEKLCGEQKRQEVEGPLQRP